MARLRSYGYELNTTTQNIEFELGGTIGTIGTSVVRSGVYSGRCSSLTSATPKQIGGIIFSSSSANGPYFARTFFMVATLPSAENAFFVLDNANLDKGVYLTIDSGGVLRLYDEDGVIGSASSALSRDTQYYVELKVDRTAAGGSHVVSARLNGAEFASATNRDIIRGFSRLVPGGNQKSEAQSTGDWYFDDLAINDSIGSFQNSWPGEGKIIHLKPNAAGDNSAWTNDYLSVDEVTPDNATTLVSSNTLDQIDDHDIEAPASLGTSDTINVVQVGVRFNGVGASANASFVLRIKASASGTVEESSAITPSDATWVTNAAAAPRNYSLTLYDLPGGSTTAWTKADLEAAQIGYRLSATSTNAAQVSTVWLLVDYTPVYGTLKAKPRRPVINWKI